MKLLGVAVDKTLDFIEHVSNLLKIARIYQNLQVSSKGL